MLVYPGSDWDASRSFAERGRIELAGRKGFVRAALGQRVPIVPVVSVGTHEQLIILSRGEGIARALHMPQLMRTKTFPIALALPWGLTSGLVPYLPLPAQTTVAFGPPLDFAELFPGGLTALSASAAEAHAADEAMVDRGYVASVAEAFAQYLGEGCPAYIDRLRLSCEQAMTLIRGAGGVSVLAHPGLIHSDNAVHSLIARGIRGLEVHYPQHDAAVTAHYAALARRFGLLVTGGSDFHGIPGEGGAVGECGVSETELAALATATGIAADTHV
jgi:hypothetical protein